MPIELPPKHVPDSEWTATDSVITSDRGTPSTGRPEKPKKVPIRKISLKEADGYVKSEQAVLVEKLTKLRLFGQQFVYHAFFPSRRDMTIATGTPHRQSRRRANELFCMLSHQLTDPTIEMNLTDYLQYAAEKEDSDYGMFAVYDKSQLDSYDHLQDGTPIENAHYVFKNPENKLAALVAVVEVYDY